MKRALLALAALAPWAAHSQDQPLAALPYTPSLETTFLDRSADPCVDFYGFACGNWNKLNPIPADQARWDVYAKLETENQQYLWGILDDASKPSAARTANQQKIGDYFGACMDEAAIEKAGAAPLKPRLDADRGAEAHFRDPRAAGADAPGDERRQPAVRVRIHRRISPIPRASSPSPRPAGWACRTAITTSRPTPNPRRRAHGTWRTWRPCCACWAKIRRPPAPRRTPSWRSRPRWPRPR